MEKKLTTPPKKEFQSFHDFPIVTDLDNFEADIAFLGIPFGDPYSMGEASNDQCTAPTHIRRYCERALRGLDRYDFDIGGTLLNGEDIRVVDCGDVSWVVPTAGFRTATWVPGTPAHSGQI